LILLTATGKKRSKTKNKVKHIISCSYGKEQLF